MAVTRASTKISDPVSEVWQEDMVLGDYIFIYLFISYRELISECQEYSKTASSGWVKLLERRLELYFNKFYYVPLQNKQVLMAAGVGVGLIIGIGNRLYAGTGEIPSAVLFKLSYTALINKQQDSLAVNMN